MKPKQFDRDLYQQLSFPVISWSSMNAFLEWNKDSWYRLYVLGQRTPINNLMKIGIEVGEKIVSDSSFLPSIERPEIFEHNLSGVIGGVKIIGHLDGYTHGIGIDEYKTSVSKGKWDQKKVDSWGQLTFYCLLIYIHYKIPPEKLRLRLYSIPIEEKGDFSYTVGEPIMFKTKRTMADILKFTSLIKETHKAMKEYIKENCA